MKPAPGEFAGGPDVYWEPRLNALVAAVPPSGCEVSRRPDLWLTTLLGSCVAACICDPEARIGGLNHFLLPDDAGAGLGAQRRATRYGVNAMEVLINGILTQGARRDRLEAKLFGGADVIALSAADSVGHRNQRFTLDYLRREGIAVSAMDLGGTRARRVFFQPSTNRVLVQLLDRGAAATVRRDEARLRRASDGAPPSGGMELF